MKDQKDWNEIELIDDTAIFEQKLSPEVISSINAEVYSTKPQSTPGATDASLKADNEVNSLINF